MKMSVTIQKILNELKFVVSLRFASLPTITMLDVSPGNYIPNKFTNPFTPCLLNPSIQKSVEIEGLPKEAGCLLFDLTPE